MPAKKKTDESGVENISEKEAKAILENTNDKIKLEVKEPDDANNEKEKEKEKEKNEAARFTRLSNKSFFSQDILGYTRKEGLKRPIELKSRTGKALFNLTFERIDAYLDRPKEIANLNMARDVSETLNKLIENKLTELENFVNRRHRKVKSLYDVATEIECFELDASSLQKAEATFSSGYANRLLGIIIKADEASYMAGYLEKIGQFNMSQEAELNAEIYRKVVEVSRSLMVNIGRTIIGVRRLIRERNKQAQQKAS